MGHMKRTVLLALLVLATVAAVAAVWWSGRQPAPEVAVRDVQPHEYQADTRPTITVYGDSISQAQSGDFGTGDFSERSWVHYVTDDLRYLEGYARSGLRAADFKDLPLKDTRGSVVVWQIGTNDMNTHVPVSEWAADTKAFYEQTGVEPEQFIVIANGPTYRVPKETVDAWNTESKAYVEAQGWTWIDPYESMRTPDGRWKEGYSYDQLHPDSAGAELIGAEIVEAVRELTA